MADLSVGSRSFDVVKKWTYLLFDEFFIQGDLEKEQSLPVSFLCDRATTNVAKAQPGFLSFIVQPLFTALVELSPAMQKALDNVKENKAKWEQYTETEEDKNVYCKKPPVKKLKWWQR